MSRSTRADDQHPRRRPRIEWRICSRKGVPYRLRAVLADGRERHGPGVDQRLVQHGMPLYDREAVNGV